MKRAGAVGSGQAGKVLGAFPASIVARVFHQARELGLCKDARIVNDLRWNRVGMFVGKPPAVGKFCGNRARAAPGCMVRPRCYGMRVGTRRLEKLGRARRPGFGVEKMNRRYADKTGILVERRSATLALLEYAGFLYSCPDGACTRPGPFSPEEVS